MATVEEFVVRVLGFLLYWFYIIIFVSIIVKFIQMIMNIGGFGSGGKGGKGGDGGRGGEETPAQKRKREKKEEKEKRKQEKKDRIRKRLEDAIDNPGKIQFVVKGLDGEPLRKVRIHVKPAKKMGKTAKEEGLYMKVFEDYTDDQGRCPQGGGYWKLPSTSLRMDLNYWVKYNWFNPFERYKKLWHGLGKWFGYELSWGRDRVTLKTTLIVEAGTENTERITMPVESEKAANFEPKIRYVDTSEEGKLKTGGRLDRIG